MKNRIRCYIFVSSSVLLFLLISVTAWAENNTNQPVKWVSPEEWFIYPVIIIVFFAPLLIIFFIQNSLRNTAWTLSEALSEEIEVTATDKDGKSIMDTSDKPVMIRKLCASSSRMIAFIGMIVTVLMFLAFGIFTLFEFAKTGSVPDSINQVVNFLMAGLILFAPYVVNKFSDIFQSFLPGK